MSQLPILTRQLTQRIEALVAPEVSELRASPDAAAPIVVRFGRSIVSKAKQGRPANKVFCFGQQDLGRLEEILAFYAVDDLTPGFYLAPMGFTPQVAAALTAAGFAQHSFQQTILYGLPRATPPQFPPGVTVERVTTTNLEAFVQATAAGFEWPEPWRDAAMAEMRSRFRPEGYHFLARYQGEPAGVGSLDLRADGAGLKEGAVIPRFRRQGIHLALLHQRLYIGHTLGCSIVVGGAVFGSGSFRNQQRSGLRVAYIESGWGR